jgi:DNA polymerase III delta prime subunit
MITNDFDKEHLEEVAKNTLDVFSQISADAERTLSDPHTLSAEALSRNTFTDQEVARTAARHNEDRLRSFQALAEEPSIARIVARDSKGAVETYFITRATTPNRTPTGCKVTSSLARVGRIASLPVGDELEIDTPTGTRTLVVLERALLRPSRTDQEWDSQDTILEGDGSSFMVKSLRSLLEQAIESEDPLETLLAQERLRDNVVAGIRRSVIKKMGLRDQPILDKFQDEIFRLPLDKQLLLLGPPGTGKTTTLIRRLGQKLSSFLEEREKRLVESAGPDVIHSQSWLMFTPTELLKQYVKEAFAREGIPASDRRIVTWTDYRRELARSRFGILKTATGSGSFVLKNSVVVVNDDALARQTGWYSDFFDWQTNDYWSTTGVAAQALLSRNEAEAASIGKRVQSLIQARKPQAEGSTFIAIGELSDGIRAIVDSMKKETDGNIRKALNTAVRSNPGFLDELGRLVAGLAETDDVDEQDGDDDEEARPAGVGTAAAVAAYERAVRAHCRAVANKRAVGRTSRSGRIMEWLGARIPSNEECAAIGSNLQVQDAFRRFLNPLKRYVDGISSRYRRYRRLRQSEGRWYQPDGFGSGDITPLEVDVILLATLRTAGALLNDRTILADIENPRYAALLPVKDLFKNQIMVDEATDFSPVQLACMGALANPQIRSFFACGDFNQRITEWGLRSEEDMRWCFPNIDVRAIETTYRHSRQLNELAKALVRCSSGVEARAVLPERVDNDAVMPVFGRSLASMSARVAWLADRITEIERLTEALPSVAVLVNSEAEVQGIAESLNQALEPHNIRAVPCPNGQVMGQDSDVRVFDIQHIKGLEFEAVFFIGVDELAAGMPALFDKYLYVGATRAATYLGLTCSDDRLPDGIQSLGSMFGDHWQLSS